MPWAWAVADLTFENPPIPNCTSIGYKRRRSRWTSTSLLTLSCLFVNGLSCHAYHDSTAMSHEMGFVTGRHAVRSAPRSAEKDNLWPPTVGDGELCTFPADVSALIGLTEATGRRSWDAGNYEACLRLGHTHCLIQLGGDVGVPLGVCLPHSCVHELMLGYNASSLAWMYVESTVRILHYLFIYCQPPSVRLIRLLAYARRPQLWC